MEKLRRVDDAGDNRWAELVPFNISVFNVKISRLRK